MQLRGQAFGAAPGDRRRMDQRHIVDALAVEVDVVRKHVLNRAEAGHLARVDRIGQEPQSLTRRDQPDGRGRRGLQRGIFPQDQIGGDPHPPRHAACGIIRRGRGGAGVQRRPCFIKVNPGGGVGLHGKCGKAGGVAGGVGVLQVDGKGLRLGQDQHVGFAHRQHLAGVDAFSLGGAVPVVAERRAVDDLGLNGRRRVHRAQRRRDGGRQVGADETVPDIQNVGQKGKQGHQTLRSMPVAA